MGAPAPTCAILPSGGEQLLTGDIVVADAFPSRRQARRACVAERRRIGRLAFRLKYGEGSRHRHALRRCVGRSAPPG